MSSKPWVLLLHLAIEAICISVIAPEQINVCFQKDVVWEAKQSVALNRNCELECKSSCKGTFKWVGGPHKDLITFDNSVLEPRKYSLNIQENGTYSLTIKTVKWEDLTTYSCHCGFSQCETNLTLTKQNDQTPVPGISVPVIVVVIAVFVIILSTSAICLQRQMLRQKYQQPQCEDTEL